jgi:hypothetical protein
MTPLIRLKTTILSGVITPALRCFGLSLKVGRISLFSSTYEKEYICKK